VLFDVGFLFWSCTQRPVRSKLFKDAFIANFFEHSCLVLLCRDDEVMERDQDRPGGAWRVQPKEGGWRTREKAKEDSWRSGPR